MLRMEAVHKTFHDRYFMPTRGGFDGVNVGHGQRHRFFAQHMLAALNGTQHPFGVFMVGKRHVHGFNFSIVQQCFKIVIRLYLLLMRSVLRQRLRGRAGATTGNSDQIGIRCFDDGGQQTLVDTCGA